MIIFKKTGYLHSLESHDVKPQNPLRKQTFHFRKIGK